MHKPGDSKSRNLDPTKKTDPLPFSSPSPLALSHSLPLPSALPMHFPHGFPPFPFPIPPRTDFGDAKFDKIPLTPIPPFNFRRDSYPAIFQMQLQDPTSPADAHSVHPDIPISPFDIEFLRPQQSQLSTSFDSFSTRRPSESSLGVSPAAVPPLPFFFNFPFSVPEYSSNYTNNVSPPDENLLSTSVPVKSKKTKRHRKTVSVDTSVRDIKESGSSSPYSCEKCGKVYKHPSCLAKHRWEHTDLWRTTTKLSLSKHQQVQILEAASILVNLGNDGETVEETDVDMDDEVELEIPISKRDKGDMEVVKATAAAALAMVSMRENGWKNEKEFKGDEDEEIDIERLSPDPEVSYEYDMDEMMMDMEILEV